LKELIQCNIFLETLKLMKKKIHFFFSFFQFQHSIQGISETILLY